MTPTSAAPAGAPAAPDADFFTRYICGLMAERAISPVEHAILRTLAVRATMNTPGSPVRCSLPALAERVGRDQGAVPEEGNRQVRQSYAELRKRGLVRASRDGAGRGHAYHALLSDRWERRREPAWPDALGASRCLSLQVSPVGPTGERDYHELLWALDRDGVRTGARKEWAEWLNVSARRVLPRLERLAAAGIGVSLEELPPEPRQPRQPGKPGERGRKPRRYRLTATKPPAGRYPDGAKRHRARQQEERELVRQLTAPVAPVREDGSRAFASADDGSMYEVPYRCADEDEDLPDDLFDAVVAPEPEAAGSDNADALSAADEDEDLAPDDAPEDLATLDAPEATAPDGRAAEGAEVGSGAPPAREAPADEAPASAGEAPAADAPEGDAAGADTSTEPTPAPPASKRARAPRPSAAELQRQEAELRDQLWNAEQADALIEVAEGALKTKRMSAQRRINYIYRPILAAQERIGNRHQLWQALDEVRKKSTTLKEGRPWEGYLNLKLNDYAEPSGPRPGTNAAVKAAHSPDALARQLRERLAEAYALNRDGNHQEAQAALAGLLRRAVALVAPALYDGDEALARAAIVEAFKRGSTDAATKPTPDHAAFLDYLPETTWPHAGRLACEDAAPAPSQSAPDTAAAPAKPTGRARKAASAPPGQLALNTETQADGDATPNQAGAPVEARRPEAPRAHLQAVPQPPAQPAPHDSRVLTITTPRPPAELSDEDRRAAAKAALFAPRGDVADSPPASHDDAPASDGAPGDETEIERLMREQCGVVREGAA